MKFCKLAASGNDFIVIDNRRHIFPEKNKKYIQQLCAFHTGIGADGILLLENSRRSDIKMRIFNPDASEPRMCGNGARCMGLYAWKNKLMPKKFTMETLAGIITAEVHPPSKVTIYLTQPKDIRLNLTIRAISKIFKIHAINTGVPHGIIFAPTIEKIDVENIGRSIRHSQLFAPEGANVDFVKIIGKNRIVVRTYERGVEKETLACGTGVTASAFISVLVKKLKSPVYVETRSGDTLVVDIKNVSLTGPAQIVFEGIVRMEVL